ncbi:MAG: cation diffusion facilitator family transporter [Bacteroidetes bacterium]|jgi:cation diffusion facilitator family transporter|nr:cation diffusion facilitator family transporter [Bacteroidota bacterium]
MKLTLIVGFLLMCLKFLAFYLTQSNAILTDAIESIVNVLAGSFALYSLYYAAKPKDEDHPYGHGKIEFLSTGVEGGMVTLAGLAMTIKGIHSFFDPNNLQNVDIGLGISLFSGIVNYFLARTLIKKGMLLHSSTMVADGKHLLTDTWSSAGLVLGLIIIYFTNLFWIDYVITIGLGIFITVTGFHLIKESIFNLLDKADYGKIEHLISVLNVKRNPSWIDIHNLRVVKYGSVVHVDCHMTLPWYYTLEESHKEVDSLDKLVTTEFSHEIEFFIHADPCVPKSCSICEIHDCKVRKDNFVKRLEWKMGNVLPDEKHTASSIL